jgi:hypothetical protein
MRWKNFHGWCNKQKISYSKLISPPEWLLVYYVIAASACSAMFECIAFVKPVYWYHGTRYGYYGGRVSFPREKPTNLLMF